MENRRKLVTLFGLGVIATAILLLFTRRGEAAVVTEAPINLPSGVRRWWDMILKYSRQFGVDPNLVAALMWQESGGDWQATSPTGPVGLMQVAYSTAQSLGFRGTRAELYNPETNLYYGVMVIRDSLRRYGQDYYKAVYAYYSGVYPSVKYGVDADLHARRVLDKYRMIV